MPDLPPLASEINRIIDNLAGAGTGLTLLSLSTSSVPASVLQALTRWAAAPEDILGTLVDGSVAALTLRPHGTGGEKEIEERFVERLEPAMIELCERRLGGRLTLWLRAVHRPACAIATAPDLIGLLFDAEATPITFNADSDPDTIALRNYFGPAPRVPGISTPFIEPVEKLPPIIRLAMEVQQFEA